MHVAIRQVRLLALATALLGVASAGGEVSGAATDDDRRAIERANADLAAALARGDARTVAAMYTEAGQLFPPQQDVVTGRGAIEKFWQGVIDAGIGRVELKTSEVEAFGDALVESGRSILWDKAGQVLDEGKYLVLWKRVDGRWKLHRDCWNSSRPAARSADSK